MSDEQNPPKVTPDKSSATPTKAEDVSPVPFAEKEIVKHEANKAKIKATKIARRAFFVGVIGCLIAGIGVIGQYYKKQQNIGSQQIIGSNNVQAIIPGSNNQAGNDNRSQSPSFDNSPITSNGNVNLGVQSNSGNSVTGNSKQIINGTDNSTMNNFVVSNITVLVSQLPNVQPASAVAPSSIPTPPPTALTSPVSGDEWPALGATLPVKITSDLPKTGPLYNYEFYQKVDQGDRLHFDIVPVNGAAMRTWIRVYEDGNNNVLEASRMGGSEHWTMTKGIPGERVTVQISSFSLGTLNVRVTKAN